MQGEGVPKILPTYLYNKRSPKEESVRKNTDVDFILLSETLIEVFKKSEILNKSTGLLIKVRRRNRS